MQTFTVPQDQLLSSISEEMSKRHWVFLHSNDVKTLLRTGNVNSSGEDGLSLTWKKSGDKLLLTSMSEELLFCQKIYEDNSSSLPASTPEASILLRLEE